MTLENRAEIEELARSALANGEAPLTIPEEWSRNGDHPAEAPGLPDYPADALPTPMRGLVEAGAKAGLPAALMGGATLAAAAAAIGGQASISPWDGWAERAILWPVLVAPSFAGKTPALGHAFAPLRTWDAQIWADYRAALEHWKAAAKDQRGPRPRPSGVLIGDATMEANARTLDARGGASAFDMDELAVFLEGLGQYVRGASRDRGKLLDLWGGDPWQYTRVGRAPEGGNQIEIYIARPTVVISGGLQPSRIGLLGTDEDGMAGRWLVHAAGLEDPTDDEGLSPAAVSAWSARIGLLLRDRALRREWRLDDDARAAFKTHRLAWKHAAREATTGATALGKADVHTLRAALVLAELEAPGTEDGIVTAETIDRAARVVGFSVGCWQAQHAPAPPRGLDYKSGELDRRVDALRHWAEQRGGRAELRKVQQAKIGGRTATEHKLALRRYAETYPGTVGEKHYCVPGRQV